MGTSKKWLALTPEERAKKRKIYRDRYKNKHPDKIKKSNQKYKKKNKDKISEAQRERSRINKLKAIEYLGGQCTDCKTSFPQYVYDFHHEDPKIKDFGIARIMGRKWKNIVLELDKCVLLCSNCHRIRHNSDKF